MKHTLSREQLLELANEHGTPLYVYDAQTIRNRYEKLLSCFTYPQTKLFYAMKANYNPHVLKVLLSCGANIDAVSPAEVHLALSVGFAPEQIIYTANMMSEEEMREVHSLGVLFNIGSLSELERYGQLFSGSDICLRFNPDVVAGHHEKVRTGGKDTKFGITLDKLDLVKALVKSHSLRVVGIHEHTGSGIPEVVDMKQGLKNILHLVDPEHFPDLRFVDFGGGFQISYRPDEAERDYSTFGREVSLLFSEVNLRYERELEMYFEPGRYLVCESGMLLTKVTVLKENRGKRIVGTNAGFNQLIRPMFYDAYHEVHNLSKPEGELQLVDVAGNICETGDYFAEQRNLPVIHEGDILGIADAGAYCYAMGGVYNLRAMPTELLVDGEKVLVARKGLSSKALAQRVFDESSL